MLVSSSLLLSVLSLLASGSTAAPAAKMVADIVPAGRRLSSGSSSSPQESHSTIIIEDCSPLTTFEFPLSGGDEGKGMVGLLDNPNAKISMEISDGSLEFDAETVHRNVLSVM